MQQLSQLVEAALPNLIMISESVLVVPLNCFVSPLASSLFNYSRRNRSGRPVTVIPILTTSCEGQNEVFMNGLMWNA